MSKTGILQRACPCSADVAGYSEYQVSGWFFPTLNFERFWGWVIDYIQKCFTNSWGHLGVTSLLVAAEVFIVEQSIDGARAGKVYLSFFEMYQLSEAGASVDGDDDECSQVSPVFGFTCSQ